MHLEKTFRVQEVHATTSSNAPFRLILAPEPHLFYAKPSTCSLDRCAPDLVGKSVVALFELREVPIVRLGPYDLVVRALTKTETSVPTFAVVPPALHTTVQRELELITPCGDGMHPEPLPCPYFHFSLYLSPEEYAACLGLSPQSVFACRLIV